MNASCMTCGAFCHLKTFLGKFLFERANFNNTSVLVNIRVYRKG